MIKTIKEKIRPIGTVSIDSEFEYDKKIDINSLFKFISIVFVYIDNLVLYDGKTDVVIYYGKLDELIYDTNIDVDKKKLKSIIKSKNHQFNTRMQYYTFAISFEQFEEDIDFVFKYDKESGKISFKGTSTIDLYDEIKEYFNK